MFGAPSRRLRARSGREIGSVGLLARSVIHVATLLAESTRRVGTAWPADGLKAAGGPVNRTSLLAEKNLTAARDEQLLERHRVEIGLDAVALRIGAVDFIAAAIDLRLAHLPALLLE